jgi:hypothetical protein
VTDALVLKLTALTATDDVFIGSARVISLAGVPAPLSAVLAEIDTAVLERTLVFDIDGIVLRAAVAGRRLRGLIDFAGLPQSATALAGKVLSQDDPATVQAVGTMLAELCSDARQITVSSQPAASLGNPSEGGIAAAVLADMWNVPQEIGPQSQMVRFLTANQTAISAYLHAIDGTITATKGDTAPLDIIWRDQFGPFRKRQKAIFPRQDSPLLVCLDNALDGGHAVAIAVTGEDSCVFAYDGAAIGSLLASWRMLTK